MLDVLRGELAPSASARARPPAETLGDEDDLEIDFEEVAEMLHEHRVAWAADDGPRREFFVGLRGGAHTLARAGVAYDC